VDGGREGGREAVQVKIHWRKGSSRNQSKHIAVQPSMLDALHNKKLQYTNNHFQQGCPLVLQLIPECPYTHTHTHKHAQTST